MREIKFRVWDKLLKVMEKALVVYFNNQEVYFIHKGSSQTRGFANVILMQSTNIFDKHGKEIFEGDILKSDSEIIKMSTNKPTGKRGIALSVILWNIDGWGYYHLKNIQNCPYTIGFKTKGISIHASFSEIVGNIYETPELTEEEWQKLAGVQINPEG